MIDLIFGFNATFSNISAISWRPVLVIEEDPMRTTDHGKAVSNARILYTNILGMVVVVSGDYINVCVGQ
jgi:hypothetical protein